MKKKYIVTLTDEERRTLQEMLSRGKAAARKLMHARIHWPSSPPHQDRGQKAPGLLETFCLPPWASSDRCVASPD